MEYREGGFMFYETFKEGIDEVKRQFGEKAAEDLAIDIIYYGVDGKRITKNTDVSSLHNALMISYQSSIDKSKEHYKRVIKETEVAERTKIHSRKKQKYYT